MRVKGVIFDMDGLMIDTEGAYGDCMIRASNELGYPVRREHALMLRSLDHKLAEVLMKEIFGSGYEHGAVMERYTSYVNDYFSSHTPEVKPGLYELLDYLEENGYQKAVATSTNIELAMDLLTRAGIDDRFTCVYSGEDLENSKPAPDIYLMAAEKLGFRPEECVALEDSPNGVKAAAAAGCNAVMVPDLTEPEEEIQKLLYAKAKSLDKVIEVLEQLESTEE